MASICFVGGVVRHATKLLLVWTKPMIFIVLLQLEFSDPAIVSAEKVSFEHSSIFALLSSSYCIFDQINAALVSIRLLHQNINTFTDSSSFLFLLINNLIKGVNMKWHLQHILLVPCVTLVTLVLSFLIQFILLLGNESSFLIKESRKKHGPEDWSDGCWKFSFVITGINYILKHSKL